MKIYVITKGDYSDYHICAVATDRQKAELLKIFHSTDYDNAEIEEYETDDNVRKLEEAEAFEPIYRVIIDRNGRIVSTRVATYHDPKDAVFSNEFDFYFGPGYNRPDFNSDYVFVANLITKDAEHAIKIACDKRAEMIERKREDAIYELSIRARSAIKRGAIPALTTEKIAEAYDAYVDGDTGNLIIGEILGTGPWAPRIIDGIFMGW